jgi:signal peptidase I
VTAVGTPGKVPQSLAQARIDLATELLRRFGEIRFVVRGSSMIPAIYPGDLLTVSSQSGAEARRGQIVLCLREGRFCVHRIIRHWRNGNRFLFATRGDALQHEDPLFDESELLGSVTSIVRYGQRVDVARIAGLWMKLLRIGVRRSSLLARTLLSSHALRMRLSGHSHDAFANSSAQVLDCM